MEQELKRNTTDRMSRTIDALKKDFASIRTGRASLALLDGLTVNYYDTPTPLQQLASLSIPESRQIAIHPWDPKVIPDIEKAILKSDLGLTPMNDGKMIRINIPPLTESGETETRNSKNWKRKNISVKISSRSRRMSCRRSQILSLQRLMKCS
ncbi:MAG: frr [Nitrospirae bacterium]|nr:frr [Nitrospirota bacterium]